MPNGLISTVLEVLGIVLVVGAAMAANPLLGVFSLGIACVAVGVALGARSDL